MKTWVDSRAFTRFLEIIPGFTSWMVLILPFILAPIFPSAVAYFILAFNLYWFGKALNLTRHLMAGYFRMKRNMKIDWYDSCKKVSTQPEKYLKELLSRYERSKNRFDHYDFEEIDNLKEHFGLIKNYKDVLHVVFITNYMEDIEITGPTYQAVLDSNYDSKKIITVACGEGSRDGEGFKKVSAQLKEKYDGKFRDMLFFAHEDQPGEVKGKGSNLYSAGQKFMEYYKKNLSDIGPENILITNLDADHIVNQDYFARLTYKFIIDPNRENKTYQPVAALFNNIWDAPASSRIAAVASSLWQVIESMRPYRIRTFAAHSQNLKTLIATDFWSNQTVVEDGHQYWRTYFTFNGNIQMIPLLIPIYQDCVLAENLYQTTINQYKQRRRWAWGISDFPFVVKNFIKHPEIPFFEKFIQTFRLFGGHTSWASASFLIAFAWVPLALNTDFQNTVLAHNVTIYTVTMARLAWVGIVANVWLFFFLLPPRPSHHKRTRYISFLLQWILSPVVALLLSALPALESQTRLMLGQSLNVFWLTPKYRRTQISGKDFEK